MKKTIVLTLFITVCFLFVCSSAVLAADKATKTLEFWSWNNEGDYPFVHEDAELRYEKDNPSVDVKREYISYAQYLVKLKTLISGMRQEDTKQIAQLISWLDREKKVNILI